MGSESGSFYQWSGVTTWAAKEEIIVESCIRSAHSNLKGMVSWWYIQDSSHLFGVLENGQSQPVRLPVLIRV